MRKRALTLCAEISIKTLPSNGTSIIFAPKSGMGSCCDHLQNTGKFLAFSENFGRSGSQSEKMVIPRKARVLPFFPNIPPGFSVQMVSAPNFNKHSQ